MNYRLAGAALIVLVALGTVVFGQSGDGGGRPKLVIDSPTHNAGDVKSGAVVSHVYEVKNEGKANLEIKNIVPSCGCETVDFDRVIAPGAVGKITLKVQTTGYNGPITKTAAVTTNDPERPNFDLTIQFNAIDGEPRGHAVGPFIISPESRAIASAVVGSQAHMMLTVYSTGEKPPKITGVKSEGKFFTLTLEPSSDGSRYLVRAASAEKLAAGRYSEPAKLLTDSKEHPEIDLTFEAVIEPPLRMSPQNIRFDRVVSQDGEAPRASKFVFINQAGGPALEIKKVDSTLPFLTAALESTNPGKTYILRVKFTGAPPPGRHEGKITLATNIPSQPTLEVKVSVGVE